MENDRRESMTDTRDEIESLVRMFVDELDSLVRKSALESVRDALEEAAPAAARGARRSPPRKRKAPARRKKASRRRSRASSEKLAAGLTEFLAANPGSRMEEIREGMGVATKTLRPVANRLIADGVLRKKGEKRSTRYYVKGKRKK